MYQVELKDGTVVKVDAKNVFNGDGGFLTFTRNRECVLALKPDQWLRVWRPDAVTPVNKGE